MAQHKEHLKDLVPEDCVAINEIIDYAQELAEREKKEGWEKFWIDIKSRVSTRK